MERINCLITQGMNLRSEIEAFRSELFALQSTAKRRPHQRRMINKMMMTTTTTTIKSTTVAVEDQVTLPKLSTPSKSKELCSVTPLTDIKMYGLSLVSKQKNLQQFTPPNCRKRSFHESPDKENLPLWNGHVAKPTLSTTGLFSMSEKMLRSRKFFDDFGNFDSPERHFGVNSLSHETSIWSVTPLKEQNSYDSETKSMDQTSSEESISINDVSCILGAHSYDQASSGNLREAFHSTFAYPLHSTMNEAEIQLFLSPGGEGRLLSDDVSLSPHEPAVLHSGKSKTLFSSQTQNPGLVRQRKPRRCLSKIDETFCQRPELQNNNHNGESKCSASSTEVDHDSKSSTVLMRRQLGHTQLLTSTAEDFPSTGAGSSSLGDGKRLSSAPYVQAPMSSNQTNFDAYNFPTSVHHRVQDCRLSENVQVKWVSNSIRTHQDMDTHHRRKTERTEFRPVAKSCFGCNGQIHRRRELACKTTSQDNHQRKCLALRQQTSKTEEDRILMMFRCRCGCMAKRPADFKNSSPTEFLEKCLRQKTNTIRRKLKHFAKCAGTETVKSTRVQTLAHL